MFIGEYSHTIDEKGRVALPAKFRGRLAEGVIITRGLDNCLWVYPRAEWEKLAEKLAALPISSKQGRALSRLMLAGAMDAELDGQGRVILPEYLRKYAGLGKHAVIAGLYNRLEIWEEDAWHNYRQQTESAEDIAEGMAELGI